VGAGFQWKSVVTTATYYGLEPWSAIDIKERDWYVPELQRAFRQGSNYSQLVPIQVDFNAVRTKKMIWTGLWNLEPDITAIGARALWLDTMHPDGWQVELELASYGGKIALNKYDELITFFRSGGRQAGTLAPICNDLMRFAIVDHLEKQIRNAFLGLPMRYIVGGGTGFGDIAGTDVFDPDMAMDVCLEFAYNEVLDPNNPNGVSAVAFASPGQIYQAQQDETYIARAQYNDNNANALMRYEMGMYKGLRYVQHPINTLWNCGTIKAQATVSEAVSAGDGAPDPASTTMYGAYKVGQQSGPTRYIQLGTMLEGAITDFDVGDKVSIHTERSDGDTQPYTVVNAPLPTDGTKVDRVIQAIDTTNNRLTFDKPIQKDYDTDLGSTVYAYVTKALHIHAAVVIAAPGAVVGGFAQPPKIMFPPAIDDREAMYRITWDSVHNYGLFRPETAVVIFSAGYASNWAYKRLGNE